jgi:hypothetical protein
MFTRTQARLGAIVFVAATLTAMSAQAAVTWSADTKVLTDSDTQLQWVKTTEVTARQAEGFRIATVSQAQELALHSGFAADGTFRLNEGATATGILAFGVDAQGVQDGNPAVAYRLGLLVSNADQAAANQVISIRSSYNSPSIDPSRPNGYFPASYSFSTTIGAPSSISASLYSFQRLAQSADGTWYVSPGSYTTYDATLGTTVQVPTLTTPVSTFMVRSVPEPGTWALMALGLVGMLGASKASRRAAPVAA